MMEQKMIAIPFDVERAKRIQAGEEPGKIVTRDNKDARIVCFDAFNDYTLVVLIKSENSEYSAMYNEVGQSSFGISEVCPLFDLVLQVPEWTQYKDGDVIYCHTTDYRGDRYIWIAVMKELYCQDSDRIHIDFYFSIDIEGKCKGETVFDGLDCCADYVRLATEEEKQKLIDALKQSTDPRAKEYLKRFFGIEEKKECEFEPFQQVLVRDDCKRRWICALFNFYDRRKETSYQFVCIGGSFRYCIPYNEQTKHLLGTTDNWEE